VRPGCGLVTGGTTVSITGTGFTSGATVQFGSTPATSVTVLPSTSLKAATPPGSGLVDVTVTTPDGTSPVVNGDRFTYIALPTVTGVSPATGGNTVTITGTGFHNIFGFPGVTTVDFGSVPSPSFTVDSDTRLTATVPPGSAGTVDVTLDGSQVDGLAYVENNAATAPAVITVSGNTVNGSLYCTGNNPAPDDNGSINTVSGPRPTSARGSRSGSAVTPADAAQCPRAPPRPRPPGTATAPPSATPA
jgi:hypothetical protein